MREIYLDEAKQLGKKSFRLQQKKFKFRPITFLPAHWHTKVWWKFHPCMYIPFVSIPTGCCHVIYVIQWEGWFCPVLVRIGLPMTIKRGSQHCQGALPSCAFNGWNICRRKKVPLNAVMHWYAGKKPNGFDFSGTGVRQVFQPTKNLFHPS